MTPADIRRAALLEAAAGSEPRVIGSLSGGNGSWAAIRKHVDQHGNDNLTLMFTDTLCEDQDTYRFLIAAAANLLGVALPLDFLPNIEDFPAWEDRPAYKAFVLGLAMRTMVLLPNMQWISNGEDVWDVFERRRFLGNSRVDPCSETLKRKASDKWLQENCDPADTVVLVGLGPDEPERFFGAPEYGRRGLQARKAGQGWRYEAPLLEKPVWWPPRVEEELQKAGLWRQRLYILGFGHANCAGACCKSGMGQWRLLMKVFPERYAYAEWREQQIGDLIGFRPTILKDRRGGIAKPLSLADLRIRDLRPDEAADMGGCGCFFGDAA